MDNRGIDQDPGWINRQLRELRQAIEAIRSERRGAATEITDGDLTIKNFGNVIVDDLGKLIVKARGKVQVMHSDGTTPAVELGDRSLRANTTGNASRLVLQMAPDPIYPGLDNFLWATGFDEVRLGSASAATIVLGNRSGQTGMHLDVSTSTGNNLYLHGFTATTSNSANLAVDTLTNVVARSTSSRRYKREIADHDIDPLAVLKMRVRTWRDRAEVDKDADTTQRYIGFIAEELHDLGLTEFVSYDEQGRPDAVAYDRIPVALLIALRWLTKQVKDERARTDALEAKVTAQQKQIDDLAAKVAALTPPPTTT